MNGVPEEWYYAKMAVCSLDERRLAVVAFLAKRLD